MLNRISFYKTGLNLALKSYLNGVGFDVKLEDWFEFDVVSTTLDKGLIANSM